MADNNGYTPTQRKILDVLADGQHHTREEVHACLPDELGALSNIQRHICAIRKPLNSRGYDIICENRGGMRYRLVRILNSRYDG